MAAGTSTVFSTVKPSGARALLGRYAALLSVLLPILLPLVCPGQTASASSAKSAGLITIRLERKRGDQADAVAQSTVFKAGEILRFRLTSSMAGYLYVVDKGTSGGTSTLFPGADAAHDNRIEPGRGYLVPADGDGWFEVGGPTGFDVLYFLVSATPIQVPPAAAPQAPGGAAAPPTAPALPALAPDMLPRCNDEIFKARGECLDDSAGPAPLPRDAVLPREIAPLAGEASRDIILSTDGEDTMMRPTAAARLPLVYTFRLAHR